MIERTNKKKGGAVRLSIPVKVAYNADAFQKSIHNLLDELGCRACFSGVDCYFTTMRDFALDPAKNKLIQLEGGQASRISTQIGVLESPTLTVGMSPKASFDIKKIDLALKDIFDEIGCRACCSGHDIYFQNQFDFHF